MLKIRTLLPKKKTRNFIGPPKKIKSLTSIFVYAWEKSNFIFVVLFVFNELVFLVGIGERWLQGKLQFTLSQRGKPLLVHDGYAFGIQYIRKDKKYWQCNLSRKFNCKARVTTTDTGEIIITNNEHCHTEIRQHLKRDKNKSCVEIRYDCDS